MLVGTFHYPGKFDIFSDDVQGQIEEFTDRLAELKPTKIAVEFPQKMERDLDALYEKSKGISFRDEITYGSTERYGETRPFCSVNEIVQIGFRLGRKLNCNKIYGIDEDTVLSDELFEKIAPCLELNNFNEEMGKLSGGAESLKDLYEIHNSEEYIALDHGLYVAMNKINLGDYEGSRLVLQWYERNLKIFSNLQNLCERDDKVLVLIGSAHLKILKELVNANSEMRLAEWH